MEEEEQETGDEESLEERQARNTRNIHAFIICIAVCLTALYLCDRYSAKPINIYNVQRIVSESSRAEPAAESQTKVTAKPSGALSVPETAEQTVLVEKSIDLNTAGKEELDQLPGIGPVLAERIIEYREENNGFVDIEELTRVDGIGTKTFEKVQDYIYVD